MNLHPRFEFFSPFRLLLAALVASLVGCVQLDLKDVSSAPPYRTMIGRVFETQEDLLIRGVKRDLRATRPDYIVLMPAPGIGGPEIFNLGTIPRGRRFRITGVIDRKNSLFSKPQYVVEFSGAPITNESVESIQLYNVQAFPLYLLPVADGAAPPLNPKYLLEVNALPDPPK